MHQMTFDSEKYVAEKFGSYEFYTPKQIAACFGVGPSTIYRYIQSGRIPAVRLFGYRVSRQSLTEFVSGATDF